MRNPTQLQAVPLRALVALAAVALLAACGASNKTGAVTLSAASTSSTGGAGGAPAAPAALPAGVRVTEVDVAVRELELDDGTCTLAGERSASGSSSHSSDDSDHGECESEIGPFVAHLDEAALADLSAGKVPQVWSAGLRAGTYTELEVKICSVDPSSLKDPAQAALAAAMQGATVVVKGTYQAPGTEGGPVDFTIAVAACAEVERHVQVVVDDQGAVSNLTLNVNMASWFQDASGQPIVPDSPESIAAVAANIARALDVYGDDDHDGHCDD